MSLVCTCGTCTEVEWITCAQPVWKSPEKPKALQTQVGGSHYTDMKIQPIEYILANNIPFPEGNVIKYVSRWRNKGGLKDVKKALHHLQLLIEHEEAKGTA